MTPSWDLYCVGNVTVDLTLRPVDRLPEVGSIGLVDAVRQSAGGNAVNASKAAARLGLRVAVSGAVGDDELGTFVRAELEQAGVETAGLVPVPDQATAVTVALVHSDGERSFLHHQGANRALRREHVDWAKVARSRAFFYASFFMLPAFDGEGAADALRRAREAGCLTALDVCWDPDGAWLQRLAPALPYVDLFFPNAQEGRMITGERQPERMAARLRDLGVGTVVVKLGPDGAWVASHDASFHAPGFHVPVVDTTGAGDAFAAGFLWARLAGRTLEASARFANAAAALTTTTLGTGATLPPPAEIERFAVDEAPT